MREIKFRAWYKHSYIELSDLRGNRSIYFSPYDLGLITQGIDRKEVELEQYTGLKDKNDKEIYEGDIVLAANHNTPYEVVYRGGDCSFIAENDEREDITHLFKALPQCYEVIGNIHENPELLEQEDAKG